MTYNELNTLFSDIATGLSLMYEQGPTDQINTVFRESDKFPLCYAMPFYQLFPGFNVDGPEFLVVDKYQVQIAFLKILSSTNYSPDTNNEEKRSIINDMFVKAKDFLFNLYESDLVPVGTSVSKAEIKPLTLFQDMHASTGALLEFEISTIATLDCTVIVNE